MSVDETAEYIKQKDTCSFILLLTITKQYKQMLCRFKQTYQALHTINWTLIKTSSDPKNCTLKTKKKYFVKHLDKPTLDFYIWFK